MGMEMTIPDYHNQRRLPTNSTISLWEDQVVLYNENNMERSEDEEEEKGHKTPSTIDQRPDGRVARVEQWLYKLQVSGNNAHEHHDEKGNNAGETMAEKLYRLANNF